MKVDVPVGVGGFSVDAGDDVSFPLYTNVEEGELALFLLFICELYGGEYLKLCTSLGVTRPLP